ncbi:MAG: ABC transporter ATP-binding protein, partial [Rhodocyclaceae bacterium]|nr:ABC transporter ATP-binding protein [Rhodocyclaceae bacterium]
MNGAVAELAGGEPILAVTDLQVALGQGGRTLHPVDGVSFAIRPGQTFALVGESGCGKSLTALAISRLLPPGGWIAGGQVRFAGLDLPDLPEYRMRGVRGGSIAMIFQESATSLNPVLTVGRQVGEVLARHLGLGGAARDAAARALLEAVGIPDAARRLATYPFQLSGGMRQRVMIAMALAGQPRLLVADEPTTALDVTIQAQVLDLLARLQAERGMGMLLITHDLGVVARMAQEVGLMYAGQLVETGARQDFFRNPLHPYAQALFAALPRQDGAGQPLVALAGNVPAPGTPWRGCRFAARCPAVMAHCLEVAPPWHRVEGQTVRCHLYQGGASQTVQAPAPLGPPCPPGPTRLAAPLLDVRGLAVHFPVRKGVFQREIGRVRAVDGVDLLIRPGCTLALVGESGCGKTTVGRAILQLERSTAGAVFFDGQSLVGLAGEPLRQARRGLQMIFQDPFASLNPRLRVGEIIAEGMEALGVGADAGERQGRIAALLERVGLDAAAVVRYPHEFSGGQRQRIAIARALAVSPRLIVCDEPTSALDVSVQAQILNLMGELQRELGLAYLFISHNLAVVNHLAHEVAVMYLGRVVESGPARQVLDRPAHPYTQALLAAVLSPDGSVRRAPAGASAALGSPGEDLPSPLAPPSGCHFHPRCPKATEICQRAYPPRVSLPGGGQVACHWVS